MLCKANASFAFLTAAEWQWLPNLSSQKLQHDTPSFYSLSRSKWNICCIKCSNYVCKLGLLCLVPLKTLSSARILQSWLPPHFLYQTFHRSCRDSAFSTFQIILESLKLSSKGSCSQATQRPHHPCWLRVLSFNENPMNPDLNNY